ASLNLSKSGLFAHFKSKEALQVDVLQRAIDHFIQDVVVPALKQPRGEPRVVTLFDYYLAWVHGNGRRGSCFFMALTHEYDDRPGPIRDLLVQSQRDWYDTIARAARTAVEEATSAPISTSSSSPTTSSASAWSSSRSPSCSKIRAPNRVRAVPSLCSSSAAVPDPPTL